MKGLFITADGRPALFWRILFILIMWIALAEILVSVLFGGEDQGAPLTLILRSALSIVLVLGLVYLFRSRIDRRPWSGMALPVPNGRRLLELTAGFGLGAAMLAVVFLIEWSAGWVTVVGYEASENGTGSALRFVTAGLIAMMATGFAEELIFRGYFFQNVGERLPIWTAVLLMSLPFALIHFQNSGFSLTYVVGVVIISAFWVQTRLVTGALWFAIGWHIAWNFMQYDVLGVAAAEEPSFGGALLHVEQTGPILLVGEGNSIEGGLAVVGVLAVALALTFIIWRKTTAYWSGRLDEYGAPLKESRSEEVR